MLDDEPPFMALGASILAKEEMAKTMNKPRVGQIVVVKPELARDLMADRGPMKVVAVYDSLDEDWGWDGHTARAMYEVDPDRKAEWYAVLEGPERLDTTAVCSFEVQEVRD